MVMRIDDERLSPLTRRAYDSDVDEYLRWSLGVEPETTENLSRYEDYLEAKSKAASTIARKFSAIRRKWGIPFSPRNQAPKTSPVLAADVSRLASTVKKLGLFAPHFKIPQPVDARDRAVLMLLYLGGLRRSSVTGLDWGDWTTGKLIVKVTKGGKVFPLTIDDRIEHALHTWMKAAQKSGVPTEMRDPMFISFSHNKSNGKRLTGQSVNFICHHHLGEINSSQLRHSCCTEAVKAGVPLHNIAKHLNHSDLQTTVYYYTPTNPPEVSIAAALPLS